MALFLIIFTIVGSFSIQCDGNPGQSEKIKIQPRPDSNLCATNEQLEGGTVMKLAQCGKVYPDKAAYGAKKGSNVFTKVPVDNIPDTFQLKTDIPEPMSKAPSGTENCLYVADILNAAKLNLQIKTDICNSNESNQYWHFVKVGDSVQWIHKKTNRCIRAPIFNKNLPNLELGYLSTEECRKTEELQLWTIVKTKA